MDHPSLKLSDSDCDQSQSQFCFGDKKLGKQNCINLSNMTTEYSILSCFLCGKRCKTKAHFLAHLNVHLNPPGHKRSKKYISTDSSTDEEESVNGEKFHNNINNNQPASQGDENDFSSLRQKTKLHRRRRPRLFSSRRRTTTTTSSAASHHEPPIEPDVDSGCHSIDDEWSSCSSLRCARDSCSMLSDCLGDSESSDSDGGVKTPRNTYFWKNRQSFILPNKDRLSLAEKQLDNNDTENLTCQTCLKKFSNHQNLRRHLRLHISRDSVTPDIERTNKHIQGDPVDDAFFEGKYFCDWCPARFDNRSAARVHEGTHKGHETKCYICEKSYADRYSLRYHLRTHGIGRQIKCEHCNKSFSKPSRLDAHIRSNHKNIRDFACQICDEKFITRVHLKIHSQRHSGERPFACNICSGRFRHKASLVTHMRGHAGSRPYCCEICGKTFREPSTLKAHCRVHTGDKPYQCNLCDKSFTQRAGLNNHKKGHEVENMGINKNQGFDCQTFETGLPKLPTSLPSPPIQCGDAVFQSSPLPSFNNLKPTSSPASSPSSSTMSSAPDHQPYMHAMKKMQPSGNGFVLDDYPHDVTPPQTPPSVNSGVYNNIRGEQEDFMNPLNIQEFAHQLDYGSVNDQVESNYYMKSYNQDQHIQGHESYRHQMCYSHLLQEHHNSNEHLSHQYDFSNMASSYSLQHQHQMQQYHLHHHQDHSILDQSQFNSFGQNLYPQNSYSGLSGNGSMVNDLSAASVHNLHQASSGYC